MTIDLSYIKAGYRSDRWKWVLSLENKDILYKDREKIAEQITEENILHTYGLDKYLKNLPCTKKCPSNPWCLVDVSVKEGGRKKSPTDVNRKPNCPVGLQNTANTCWINSALQSLYHINQFRNAINSLCVFNGEESLNSIVYLLQALFYEMEQTPYAALACKSGSIFEKVAVFATREIMEKDKDCEVLKCVSEFLENIIDTLLGDIESGPVFSPLFRTNLFRVGRWKCTNCQKEHVKQMFSVTLYTLACYVSIDECHLNQCILDLETETQTGVSLVCGGNGSSEGGCGATVKVDRIVTPKISQLPELLILRNNSLIESVGKRRQHVVYPESLDLTPFTCDQEEAIYTLRSVIFHHGAWVKHFTAHVKTEDGKWFNFNDDHVGGLIARSAGTTPTEMHPNYLSLVNIANKYKNKYNVRVSRGAFIWIYERNTSKPTCKVPVPNHIVDFFSKKNNEEEVLNDKELKEVHKKRQKLLKDLSVSEFTSEVCVISRQLLASWINSNEIRFNLQPSILKDDFCEHTKYDPMVSNVLKCLMKNQVHHLTGEDYGIDCSQFGHPIIPSMSEGLCRQCLAIHAHHILFREKLKEIYVRLKKKSSREPVDGFIFFGEKTFNSWPGIALGIYLSNSTIGEKLKIEDAVQESNDTERPKDENIGESSTTVNGSTPKCDTADNDSVDVLFNSEIICPHKKQRSDVNGFWIPKNFADEVLALCKGKVDPNFLEEDFGICLDCKRNHEKFMTCFKIGKEQRKKLWNVYCEKRKLNSVKYREKKVFLISREFHSKWKQFIRSCEKDDVTAVAPSSIDNSSLICQHGQLFYTPEVITSSKYCVVLLEEDWNVFKEYYSADVELEARIGDDGVVFPTFPLCKECLLTAQSKIYEEQFTFEGELIHIKQVNTVKDVPGYSRPEEPLQKKQKPNLLNNYEPTRATKRLIRGSKYFDSTDTIKDVQNFIAERTGVWPLLQSLWLAPNSERGSSPLLLSEDHRPMTLNALRIKPDETIYFQVLKSDLEKAAGDGFIEYDEMDED